MLVPRPLVEMLAGQPDPDNFDTAYNSGRLGSGLEEELRAWLTAHKDARLVVDTFASVAPTMLALTDTRMTTRRSPDSQRSPRSSRPCSWSWSTYPEVRGRGRDGQPQREQRPHSRHRRQRRAPTEARFHAVRPHHPPAECGGERTDVGARRLVGGQHDERTQSSATSRAILALLESSAEPLAPKAIGALLDENPDNVRQHLGRMLKGMLVEKVSRGFCCAVRPAADDEEG